MFVVTVDFEIDPVHAAEFHTAVLAQAANSLSREPECHVFEVCVNDGDATRFFLYEKYTDAGAFDVHLATEHFAEFNALVSSWVTNKTVGTWSEAGDSR